LVIKSKRSVDNKIERLSLQVLFTLVDKEHKNKSGQQRIVFRNLVQVRRSAAEVKETADEEVSALWVVVKKPGIRDYITSTPKSAKKSKKCQKRAKNERGFCIPRSNFAERPYLAS